MDVCVHALFVKSRTCIIGVKIMHVPYNDYSTVTDLARFLGWSTFNPLAIAV